MRKIKFIGGLLLPLVLAGCSNNTVTANSAPSVVGVKDFQCVVNSTVDFLDGVTALDKEDGDITPKMKITITPEVEVNNGYATFSKPGEYDVLYSITDSEGRTSTKRSYVDVVTRDEYASFAMPNGFSKETNGKAYFEKCGMVNGEFIVKAKGHEVAEDVKINRVFKLKTNIQYTFKYSVNSKCSGKVKVLADGKECGEVRLYEGDSVLTFKHIALDNVEESKDVLISLCFGNINGDIDLTIKGLETEYPQNAGDVVDHTVGFSLKGRIEGRFDHEHSSVEGNCWDDDNGNTAVLEITKTTPEIWFGGMFINTEIEMKAGSTYKVSFDVTNMQDKSFEIILQNKQWDEKQYEKLIFPDGHQEVEFTPNDSNKGSLWIYVQSGDQINNIKVSNIKVYEVLGPTGRDSYVIEDYVESHDGGYDCTFNSELGNFNYHIASFADVDYKEKVTSPAFFVNGSGGNYVLSFKAKASQPVEVVVAVAVAGAWDPTILWQRVTLPTEESVFTFFMNGNGSDRNYTIVWQFGSTSNQKYTDVDIAINEVAISYKNGELDV